MTRKWVWVTVALMVLTCLAPAFAMGEVVFVTKETQAKLGLRFTLTAERVSDKAVLVRVEVPKEGKLKTLRSISMTLGGGNGSPELSARLQTSAGKDGALVAYFQLSPDLANKCSVDLDTPDASDATTYTVYSVELKGYVTDRK